MITILLAWELGRGTGHAALLCKLAKALEHPGFRLIAAVKIPKALRRLPGGVEIVQAPPWPSAARSAADLARTSSASMGDILATAGVSDADGLTALLDWWEAILSHYRPDLVVAESAPAAALAARGRVPVILVGNGYTLPPCNTERFPPLHSLHPPQNEEFSLNVLNKVLRARGRATFDRLPQLYQADARVVLSFPLLDPYLSFRTDELNGPIMDYEPTASDPQSGTIFIYLSPGYPVHPEIPTCLLSHAYRMRVHAPSLPDRKIRKLARSGARIEYDPVHPAKALSDAALVIHFGGSQLASEALLAGVPQIVLSMQIEQYLTGSALQGAGLGQVHQAYNPTSLDLKLEALLTDRGLSTAAACAGQDHRAFLKRIDPLAIFGQHCHALLGGRSPKPH